VLGCGATRNHSARWSLISGCNLQFFVFGEGATSVLIFGSPCARNADPGWMVVGSIPLIEEATTMHDDDETRYRTPPPFDPWSEKGETDGVSTLRALIRFSSPEKRDKPPSMIADLGVPPPSNGKPTGPLDTAPSCEPTKSHHQVQVPQTSVLTKLAGRGSVSAIQQCMIFFATPCEQRKKVRAWRAKAVLLLAQRCSPNNCRSIKWPCA
jgi:hypothetical protein